VTPRTLILLRHAKSDWSGDPTDLDRPLAKRGQRQAPEAGRWLADSIDAIDLAVVSPANRARSTWDLASAQLADPPRTRLEDRLYDASARDLLEVSRELPDDLHTVILVGHNPALEDLATLVTNEPVSMVTSALAVIEFAGRWSSIGQGVAVLRAMGRPPAPIR
jgi:phosphohistidine phosphatase